ncbi:Gamma-butyrobetaine hydroxylase subfamily, putative [Talaromyces stipitatus ATCC 10500]|uniref:Gamma-butyrobetaine hydroxylase subfamily, putative n=1 Tax=Talaromyces stipitatus (strain ATCC 10500 / CBS 375.48 / QM 6759 / NRRL 1006) TaxID=441959 RepID=B8LXW1_TALSN|nr:Gamma-butyrobetaine hydroxylase subfamily, putative [Talaromyces stipitatus ATCC 10500]EED22776.1 Gamma-butyrobetaine hydroxylase subfamily, putative [Talaromyces stipitatus ATCC 10500]
MIRPRITIARLWTSTPAVREYSQPRQSGDQASTSRNDNKGVVKHIGQNKATIQLPKTALDQSDDRNLDVHYIQLRDACQCPRCVDPQTKQRSFRTGDIPRDIAPREIRWVKKSEVLEISWNKDIAGYDDKTHVTRLTADEIKYPSAYFHHKSVGTGKGQIFWDRKEMERDQPWVDYNDWMTNDDLFRDALNKLSLYGLLFVNDIPDSREMVAKIATRMGPLRNTFYGSTWDVRNDPKAKNVAYTNLNLGFHMDLLYVHNPPGFQLLHCLKNSCKGGESLFVDAFGAARNLDRKSWDTLASHKVPYHYDHKENYYRTTRPVLELPEDSTCRDDRTLSHINYSPPFQGPYHISPTESPEWPRKMKEYLSAIQEFEKRIEDPARIFELKLEPGQCVIFENRRVLHARRAFDTTTGERWLAGAYVDEDAVHSKMFTLRRNSGEFSTSV